MNTVIARKEALRAVKTDLHSLRRATSGQSCSTEYGVVLGKLALSATLSLITVDEMCRLVKLAENACGHARQAAREASHA